MDFTSILITIVSTLLGGGIGSVLTLRSQRKKADAEAEGTELDNVEKAIAIWREMAETLKKELETQSEKYAEVNLHVDALRREVKRLTDTNTRIIKLLDQITPDNLEKIKTKIKNEIDGN